MMNITNEFKLNEDQGLMLIEIRNDLEETYNYYLWMPNHVLVYSFGVPFVQQDGSDSRINEEEALNLYEIGYFDYEIEEMTE